MATPKLRFAGFSGTWKHKTLREIAVKVTEKNKAGEYGETLSNSAEQGIISQTDYFDRKISNDENIDGYYVVRPDDFIYNPRISTSAPVGPINRNKLGRTGVMSPLYTVFRTHDVNPEYLEWYFKSSCWHHFMNINGNSGARSDRFSISDDVFFTMPIPCPSQNEQVKIGKIFTCLDSLITHQENGLEQLRTAKRYFLQRMFPQEGQDVPELRFAGFSGAWKKQKLGDIAKFNNGRAYSQEELQDSGKYKVLRVGNFYTNDSWYYSDLELDDKFYANDGDLLYTWSATFGPHIWHGDKVIYHYHIWRIDLTENLEKSFAVQLLEQDKANILSGTNGSTMIHITKAGMEEKIVNIPGIVEQKKIGAFLSSLDGLIDQRERELSLLRKLKTYLLQNMFPEE
ncbi:MAG: restriction endonuclease subunit S [Succinivibrio sp.]|nr:restriction endonuclease subunit S [Succinivibrio sp.]